MKLKMNSYERVFAVLTGNRKDVDRIPCINSVGTYTSDFMKIYDAYWPQSHKDPEKMAKLASAAHRLCGLDNITVPFDLVVEAEVLGAPIEFFKDKVKWPSVKNFTIKDFSDLKFPSDTADAGRIPVITKAIKILKQEFQGKVPIIAYINAPFTTISSYLVDTSTFLIWVKRKPEKVHEFYRGTLPLFSHIANLYKEAGADIVTFREEGASTDNLSPIQFDQFVRPYLSELIKSVKPPRILHMCGSTLLIIDKLIQCQADLITVDERSPIKEVKKILEKINPDYPIGGNINSYSIIAKGPIERIRNAVQKVIEDGVDLVAPGCDFYLDTPTEFVKAFVDATVEFGRGNTLV